MPSGPQSPPTGESRQLGFFDQLHAKLKTIDPSGGQPVTLADTTTLISGVNLAHESKYPGLRSVPARGNWTGSF